MNTAFTPRARHLFTHSAPFGVKMPRVMRGAAQSASENQPVIVLTDDSRGGCPAAIDAPSNSTANDDKMHFTMGHLQFVHNHMVRRPRARPVVPRLFPSHESDVLRE